MTSFRLPIRVAQFPRFLSQSFVRTLRLVASPSKEKVFHLCYFTCHSYFPYLYCSLHSLVSQVTDIRFRVVVFSDQEQPLSESQIKILKDLAPGTEVILWPKSMGWGSEQISNIWRAYGLVAQDAEDHDFIGRVDSDVFFFNDRIFRAVANSRADLVGDGHYVDFKYCQGGCYFFCADAVKSILAMLERDSMESILEQAAIDVEDVAATHLARRLGMKVWLTWFMMFPDEYRRARRLTAWQRWKFSCLHFVMKNKAEMLRAYEKEIFNGAPPATYQQAIDTK